VADLLNSKQFKKQTTQIGHRASLFSRQYANGNAVAENFVAAWAATPKSRYPCSEIIMHHDRCGCIRGHAGESALVELPGSYKASIAANKGSAAIVCLRQKRL